MKYTEEEIRDFLENIPDTFEILKQGVAPELHKEYIEYSESFGRGDLSEEGTNQLSELLLTVKTPSADKKKALTILSHTGSIQAYRNIEAFSENVEDELKQWAHLAMMECRMLIESELTGKPGGFIATGLGGTEDKLRYYFLVLPLEGQQFDEIQQNVVTKEFELHAPVVNSRIETIKAAEAYIEITALIPLNIKITDFIETGIGKCNELGEFVLNHYYATNGTIPDKDEIIEIIKIVRED